jgi:hypothetical protein
MISFTTTVRMISWKRASTIWSSSQPFPGRFPGTGQAPFPGQAPSGTGGQRPQELSVTGQCEEGSFDEGNCSAIPGEPGQDYPILSEIPETSFSCDQQQYPGYLPLPQYFPERFSGSFSLLECTIFHYE